MGFPSTTIAQFLVVAHPGPDIGMPAVYPTVFLPGFNAEFARLRNRMKNPALFAGARVESPHIPGNIADAAIANRRSYDHYIVTDNRWGGDAIAVARDGPA
jgi:hypothetical protein